MIARGPIRVGHLLAVTILSAVLVCAGFVTHPAPARASDGPAASQPTQAAGHAVTFESNGTTTEHVTDAATVADFLRERNIVVGPHDFLNPEPNVPLSDGLVVTYRAAVSVTIQSSGQRIVTTSAAPDVGALLEEQGVSVGPDDVVQPAPADPLPANGVVSIVRVLTWMKNERLAIAAHTIHRIDFSMPQGTSRTIRKPVAGERDVMVRFVQREGGSVQRSIVASRVARKPRAGVVVDGVGEYQAFQRFEAHGIARTVYIAQSAMQMVATAYTANCAGCNGMTAIGRRAGHGIVAVDPRVIPLGTRLFIPGYGAAVAGDTGGAIHGLRIDLGFNSLRDAMLFGRRQVTVYRLK